LSACAARNCGQPELVEKAMGRQALALLAILDAACVGADELAQAATLQEQRLPGNRVFAKQCDIALNPSSAEHPKGQHD
jgi:hypothetical protein